MRIASLFSAIISDSIGRAGVDVASPNASDIFDPAATGRRVYAIFAFVEIGSFDDLALKLKGSVVELINDVAETLHTEVKRWGYGGSGQCNKNLGSAFLMVWRIGDQKR